MQTNSLPLKDYVDIQRQVNTYHSDGSIEGDNEPALAWAKAYSNWIKEQGLPCESILDAGCRTGYAMDIFMEQFPAARVAGVDIVPEFVARADMRGEAFVGDLQELPFEDEEFDWTFCVTAIEHCPDVGKAMSELCRVSKYGVHVITDLESEAKFTSNPSHFTRHSDTSDWVASLKQPDWQLVRLIVPNPEMVEMTWLRKETC